MPNGFATKIILRNELKSVYFVSPNKGLLHIPGPFLPCGTFVLMAIYNTNLTKTEYWASDKEVEADYNKVPSQQKVTEW